MLDKAVPPEDWQAREEVQPAASAHHLATQMLITLTCKFARKMLLKYFQGHDLFPSIATLKIIWQASRFECIWPITKQRSKLWTELCSCGFEASVTFMRRRTASHMIKFTHWSHLHVSNCVTLCVHHCVGRMLIPHLPAANRNFLLYLPSDVWWYAYTIFLQWNVSNLTMEEASGSFIQFLEEDPSGGRFQTLLNRMVRYIQLSAYLPTHPSVHPSVCPSICLSIMPFYWLGIRSGLHHSPLQCFILTITLWGGWSWQSMTCPGSPSELPQHQWGF